MIKKCDSGLFIFIPCHYYDKYTKASVPNIQNVKSRSGYTPKKRYISAPNSNAGTTGTISNNRILIVDDDKDIATSFRLGLEDEGFIVDVFNDPVLALSNYRANWYDLLLLDIRMPKMSGFELYQKIEDADNKAKVCFITAFNQYQEFKNKFPESDVDWIRKPIAIQNLVKIVRSKL